MPLLTTLIPIGFIGFIVISLFKGNWMLAIGGGVAYYLYFKLVVQGLLGMWSNPEKSSEKIAEPSEMPQEEKMRIEQGDAEAAENEREEAEAQYTPELKERAENGDAEAQYNLGWSYIWGDGVPHNYKEGVKWYRKAAEQGHRGSQNNLGLMYSIGRGVPEDGKEAAKWFTKAAEQGFAEAQYSLGVAYTRERSVPKDDKEAVKWWKKAAEQGWADAQIALGTAYELGTGVSEDYVQAYAWWNIAAANGVETSKSQKEQISSEMTKEQIAEAQKLSAEMIEANPKLLGED